MAQLPKVSIIIPVYNAQQYIAKLAGGIVALDYPKDRLQVICVDNGSQDSSVSKLQRLLPEAKLVYQPQTGSYAARNLGVRSSDGDILAFTDADCVPNPDWIKNAVAKLQKDKLQILGGKVEFEISNPRSLAEMYDAVSHMNSKQQVENRGVVRTANLIVARSVFNKVGYFDDSLKTGGDIAWSLRAGQQGYKTVYANDVIVKHPTRQFFAYLKKVLRTSTQIPLKWDKEYGYGFSQKTVRYLWLLFPPKIYKVRREINRIKLSFPQARINFIKAFAFFYLNKLVNFAGVTLNILGLDKRIR